MTATQLLTRDDAAAHRPPDVRQPAPSRRAPVAGGAPVTVTTLPPAYPLAAPAAPATVWAAIYDRVSDDRKNDARSVKRQHRANRDACTANGWIDRDYSDNDKGASRFSKAIRDDWDRLVADLDAGRVHVVILWEVSRGGRELEAWARFLNLCRAHGTLIHITERDRTYDVRRAEDWKQLATDGVDSAAETDKLSGRIRSGVLEVAVNGEPTNKCAYGYVREHDSRTKQLIGQFPDPDAAPIVRGIFERIARGVPLAAITRELNDAEVPAPRGGTWSQSGVRKVATRLAYIARRDYRGTVYTVDCVALVSDELFYTVQRILSDPRRNPHLKGNTKPGKAVHLLSGVAVCDVCEGPLGAHNRNGVRVYRCKSASVCVSIRADRADEYVKLLLCKVLSDPEEFAHLTPTDDGAVVAARTEVARLEAEIVTARGLLKAGRYSQLDYADIAGDLRTKLQAAQKAAEVATIPATLRALLTPDDRNRDMRERFADLPVAAQREVVRTVMNVRVRKGMKGHAVPVEDRVEITPVTRER